jgi:hypothetical protein
MKNKISLNKLAKNLGISPEKTAVFINENSNLWKPIQSVESLTRINFKLNDELGDNLALVKGYSSIIRDPNKKSWAYGYHLNYQGNGKVGDYHSVSKLLKTSKDLEENNGLRWKTNIGMFLDPVDSCSLLDTSDLDGFDLAHAGKMFRVLYNEFYSGLIHIEGVEQSYPYPYLCFKSQLGVCEEFEGSYWYMNDHFEKISKFTEIDIKVISSMIPGKTTFLN